jgi:hypothetical protein
VAQVPKEIESFMKTRLMIVTAVLTLVSLAGMAGCTDQSTSGSAKDLKILNHSMTVHWFEAGALRPGDEPKSSAVVVGRAQNVSAVTIGLATVAVNFYDKNKNLIATASAAKQSLRPSEFWDFSVTTVGPDAWKITSYDIAAGVRQ